MEKKFLTLKELCEYTGIGMTKLRQIVKRKNPFTIMVGNKYYIDKDKWDAYVDHHIKYQIPL